MHVPVHYVAADGELDGGNPENGRIMCVGLADFNSAESVAFEVYLIVLGQWLVTDGQWIERDMPLVEVESDKVTQELPSPIAGIVHIEKGTGEECTIGDTIGSIDESAQKPEEELTDTSAAQEVESETIASANQTRKATSLAQKVVRTTSMVIRKRLRVAL